MNRLPILSSASQRFAVALLLGLSLVVSSCASRTSPRPKVTTSRNLLFASPQGHDLYMDLYVPRTAHHDAPVVVWIFGGSWKFGSKSVHLNVRDLTDYGIAVASIQYRLSGVAKYPAQLEDCRAAVAWLRANGRTYGIDPYRIGVSGESAGGHLATLVGTIEEAPKIRAVFAMYPPSNLVTLSRHFSGPVAKPGSIDRLLGGPVEQNLALAKDASPVNHVNSSSPPFLIVHGARDVLVPLEQSQELLRCLRRSHVESRLIVMPHKGHWFRLSPSQVREVARFFAAHFDMPEPQAGRTSPSSDPWEDDCSRPALLTKNFPR